DGIAALDAIALLRRRLGLQPLPWHTIARAVAPATGEAAAWPAGSEWSTEASERAELWLQAGQRAVELGGRDDLARTCFDSALACGSEGVLTFLAGLVQAAQPRLVEAMLAAGRPLVDRGPLPPPDHGRADQSYAELLDHDDVRVVSFAAERALWLIRSGSAGVALTNAVIARARPAIVPGNAGLPVAGVVPVVRTWYCGGIPPHIDPTAACIFAACFTGDPAVAEALQALPAAAKTPGSLFVACDTAIARFPNGVPRRTADTLASAAEVAARVAAGIAHGRDRTRAALTETAVTPTWSASLERRVLDATGDDDPEVRLAAYRALATLDAELWPSRGLLHETRFDPDPRIRALRP
ncbi:MAG: hypothetical protein KDE27_01095, partial [Planctomycetes bacterium]|nr:hypothetical protein [Planctomycetota bacterium]